MEKNDQTPHKQGENRPGQPPLVSIITIVLNGEGSIRRTMESVLQQSYPNIEYIVIDGGSTDNTVALIREYEKEISHWQSEGDTGISDAFNKGIRLAHGEIVGLLNAGDWYPEDAVQCAVEQFEKEPALGVVCGAVQFYRGSEKEYLCFSEPEYLKRDMSITHPSCFLISVLYDRFGGFSPSYRLAMDYELLLRLQVNGVRFLSIPTVLANMQHDGVSEANWQKGLAETHRARKELLSPSLYTSTAYYFFLVCKRSARILLEKCGCDSLLAFYRARLALVKKYRP